MFPYLQACKPNLSSLGTTEPTQTTTACYSARQIMETFNCTLIGTIAKSTALCERSGASRPLKPSLTSTNKALSTAMYALITFLFMRAACVLPTLGALVAVN